MSGTRARKYGDTMRLSVRSLAHPKMRRVREPILRTEFQALRSAASQRVRKARGRAHGLHRWDGRDAIPALCLPSAQTEMHLRAEGRRCQEPKHIESTRRELPMFSPQPSPCKKA